MSERDSKTHHEAEHRADSALPKSMAKGVDKTDPLYTALFSAEQVRALDHIAIEQFGLPALLLMKRAGRAALDYLLLQWPSVSHITVIAGKGNNGGDGFILAMLAQLQRIPVAVLLVGDPENLSEDANQAYKSARQAGVSIEDFASQFTASYAANLPAQSVLVDALLGSGVKGAVRAATQSAIEAINRSPLPVLALDIPSGLCAESGQVLGCAVQASASISFVGLKRGMYTGTGRQLSGDISFADLGVPAQAYQQVDAEVYRLPDLSSNAQRQLGLAPRRLDAHKGDYGHVVLLGGDFGLAGAICMAAVAALRCGAGRVSVATRPEHVSALVAHCPELMVLGVTSGVDVIPLLENARVIVVGPGLGCDAWGQQLLYQARQTDAALVIDADGLNILSRQSSGLAKLADKNTVVITPHPGEAARLLGVDNAQINADRFKAVRALQQRSGATVVLKGRGSLVCSESDNIYLCDAGNPGMASAGMGDILSGVMGALLAQSMDALAAAKYATCLHAWAGDRAAQQGQCGMLASDLLPELRALVDSPLVDSPLVESASDRADKCDG